MSAPRPWTEAEVRAALGLPGVPGGGPGRTFRRVSTDTRTLEPGDLFVALAGERFDGHDFVTAALQAGAGVAVVHRNPPMLETSEERLFRVGDTLEALGALARHRRRELGAGGTRVVGISGSSGKTTVKELCRAALEGIHRVYATPGNLNNRVGLPLTVLGAPEETEVLVLEMGSNEPGEIAALTAVAAPEMGVVTTVGPAHLEKLGSVEGVLVEETALVAGLPSGGWALVGEDPPVLAERARAMDVRLRVAGWGEGADPDLRPEDPRVGGDGCWSFGWRGARVELRLAGRHAVVDALLALGVAELLEVPAHEAVRGVSSVAPFGMRGERRRVGGLTLVVDCYNANPQSLRSALDTLAAAPAPGGRVAVMGSMLELGAASGDYHREVLAHALSLPLDLVVAVGEFAAVAGSASSPRGRGPALLRAASAAEAAELLAARLSGGETVLLKASRGVALEEVLPVLEARFAPAEGMAEGEGGR